MNSNSAMTVYSSYVNMRGVKGYVTMQQKFNIIALVKSKLFESHNSVTSTPVTECNWLVMEW